MTPPPHDAWIPRYHITAERNWLNDPTGPIHWGGRYHLFFQANPHAPEWGPPHWGHVSSPDLITWTRHPHALSPDPGGPDRDGCWSGCVRIIDGRPVIYYTGVVGDGEERIESICRAPRSPGLERLTKDPANPLVAGPPASLGSGYHRDPFLWQDDDGWHLLLGSGTADRGRHGTVLIYHSADARTWRYGGVFFEAPRNLDGVDLGEHWECPQLLRFGHGDVLILSTQDPGAERPLMHVVHWVGKVIAGRFEGQFAGRLDHGDVFYAPAATVDTASRTLLWGWIQEDLPPGAQRQMPKVGALSLPRVANLVDGRLSTAPAPELTALRAGPPLAGPVSVDGRQELLPEHHNGQLEVAARITGTGGAAEWLIGPGSDTPGSIRVTVDLDDRRLTVTTAHGAAHHAPIAHRLDGADLRIYLDGSIAEVHLAGQAAITFRCYPNGGRRGPVTATTPGSIVHVTDCTVWQLNGVVP